MIVVRVYIKMCYPIINYIFINSLCFCGINRFNIFTCLIFFNVIFFCPVLCTYIQPFSFVSIIVCAFFVKSMSKTSFVWLLLWVRITMFSFLMNFITSKIVNIVDKGLFRFAV